MVVLRGERLLLRPVGEDHLPTMVAQIEEPEVLRWWGHHSVEELRKELWAPQVTGWAVVVDGETAGLVELTDEPEPSYRYVEPDLYIAQAHHGKGLGAEALRLVLRHAFEERGHHRAQIMPAAENERAIRSYASVGFKPVGIVRQSDRATDGRWRDSLLMDMLAGELID